MGSKKVEQLLRKIAILTRQNQDQARQIKELQQKLDKCLDLHERGLVKHEETDNELKGEVIKADMATVLFAHVEGFSKIAQYHNSREMMDWLDDMFLYFDQIIARYNIHKIRTIGDTYMCVGGLNGKNMVNPVEVILAAFEMKQYVEEVEKHYQCNDHVWDISFAIHTGPVSATVNGKKKNTYDIKGDTVNITTRIETSAGTHCIMISSMTYELVKEFFRCEFAGIVPVRYKDEMDIYRVDGIHNDLNEDVHRSVKGIIRVNGSFHTKMLLMRFNDLQEYMLNRLENELEPDMFYHNIKHTVDVVTQAELIGLGEGVDDEEMLLLKTAALFHDAGHLKNYDEHEKYSVEMARQILPGFSFSEQQIELICDLILSTKMPQTPRNKLQRIICDADLDYLGRVDFIPVSNSLYEELRKRHKINSFNEWNQHQLRFISKHQYFTETARNLREVNKQKQIMRIKELIN